MPGEETASGVTVGALERFGARVIFGMPGMWSLPLYESLSSSKIRHVLMRHEQFAAYAADGYARASGRLGFCIGTSGQGAVNTAAGIAVPFRDHSPVLAVTAQIPTYEIGKGWIEDLDLQAVFRPVTKFTAEVSAESAYDTLAEAYRVSLEGCPGPVHVSIPADVQRSPSRIRDYLPVIQRVEPDPSAVEAAAEAISISRSPLILAGWGAVHSGASDAVLRLAEAIPAPVATSMMGRGIIPEDHPLALGPAGRRGTAPANSALRSCDLLLALGCSLSRLTVDVNAGIRCRVIQVDAEERNFSPLASIRVLGDVALFAEALLPKMRAPGRRTGPVRPGEAAVPAPGSGPSGGMGRGPAFAKALASVPGVFVLDIGEHTIWMISALRAKRPREILLSGNMSAMGFALPAAIGAKLARPESRVIAAVGDGGFQMTAPELSTMKENGISVAVCVFNNRCLGLIRRLQEKAYGRTFGVDYFSPPDYVKLAEAYGVRGIRAESPGDVAGALRVVDEPLVIEMPVPAEEGVDVPKPAIFDNK